MAGVVGRVRAPPPSGTLPHRFRGSSCRLVLGGSPGGPFLGLSTRNSVLAAVGGTGAPLGLLLGRGVPDSADSSGSSEWDQFPGALVLPDVDVSWLTLAWGCDLQACHP